jgi:hypothetical protein
MAKDLDGQVADFATGHWIPYTSLAAKALVLKSVEAVAHDLALHRASRAGRVVTRGASCRYRPADQANAA